jgi:gluconolactonase
MKIHLLVSGMIVQGVMAQSPISDEAKVEKIADGFQFIEGPDWKADLGLLFSDIPANTVYLWSAFHSKSLLSAKSG